MEIFKNLVSQKLEFILTNLNKYYKDLPIKVSLTFEELGDNLWLHLISGTDSQSISIPTPYIDEHSNYVLGQRVKRAVGTWSHQGIEYTYWQLMAWLMVDRIETAFPNCGKKSQLEKLVLSFRNNLAGITFKFTQDLINSIVNKLPLTKTPLETWAMCHRISFLDPKFDTLNPKEALKYQKELNIEFFPWTSIGLSDSGMTNNDLLKVDLRTLSPFGLNHHNPKRNLYQTLGMKGDEEPVVMTESEQRLATKNIKRQGWNFMTCFLDLPLTFEDQLVLDIRHLDKFTFESSKIICHNQPVVSAGDFLSEGSVISFEPNGSVIKFWNKCDSAVVTDIKIEEINFNNQKTKVYVVFVETKHIFKEGIKLTNRAGNKGIVVFADCGTMFDKGRNQETPVDIIVSAQTIKKRKNYGQVLEALLTLLKGKEELYLLSDNVSVDLVALKNSLQNKGYNSNGTSPVKNQWYTGEAICGWEFWGLIKNPEQQLWTKTDVTKTNEKDLRVSGTKVSHIELKGLTTIFGPKNAVTDEILSHQQGMENVLELVSVLEVLRGKTFLKPSLNWDTIKTINQSNGYFHNHDELLGTVADESLCCDGFMLKLPRIYHITPDHMELLDRGIVPEQVAKNDVTNIFIDHIYVPAKALRISWLHSTGLFGISDISSYVNNILVACHKVETDLESLNRALSKYFNYVAKKLGTKNGEISTYALSIRYPHSAKATATLAQTGLPENWLEIHTSMAQDLGVQTGDYVIAERFPCLGFKSLRIQRVRVTDDPQCRYTIRVSGNSLVSQNLDFDGDVLFLMAFKTKAAKQALEREYIIPDLDRTKYIVEANQTKIPQTKSLNLDEMEFQKFPVLTPELQAKIVGDLTGVKRGTGTAVALSYNLMRIIEGSVGYKNRETHLALEVILDKIANSVFSQKHFGESLEEKSKEAICLADYNSLISLGFPENGSKTLCEIIRKEAKSLGVTNLREHFNKHLTKNKSHIINVIVKEKHKIYFATRSSLSPVPLLQHLEAPANDLVGHLWEKNTRLVGDRRN